jgi:hypothetical protein
MEYLLDMESSVSMGMLCEFQMNLPTFGGESNALCSCSQPPNCYADILDKWGRSLFNQCEDTDYQCEDTDLGSSTYCANIHPQSSIVQLKLGYTNRFGLISKTKVSKAE